MVKCPKCNTEIESLNAYSEIVQDMYLNEKAEVVIKGMDYIEGYTDFECPECHASLFKFESNAEDFLKGDRQNE